LSTNPNNWEFPFISEWPGGIGGIQHGRDEMLKLWWPPRRAKDRVRILRGAPGYRFAADSFHRPRAGSGNAVPCCRIPLDRLKTSTESSVEIERCASCHGIFFNPGELELLLNDQSHPVVWLDPEAMADVAEQFQAPAEVAYRPCPVCSELMNRVNFGGRRGVIIDRCRDGVWLDGGEFRQLAEWWRTGGKHRHQANELERARRLNVPARPREAARGTIDPSSGDAMDNADTAVTVLAVLGGMIAHLLS
jgi:Zn-finger nucleic acid-binding protein